MITASADFGVLGLHSLEYVQFLGAVNLFITSFLSPTLTSPLLKEILEHAQLESGLASSILEGLQQLF